MDRFGSDERDKFKFGHPVWRTAILVAVILWAIGLQIAFQMWNAQYIAREVIRQLENREAGN